MSQVPEKPKDSATDRSLLNWLPGIAGVLAAILIGSYIFTFQNLPPNGNPAAWGTFGDYMGGLLNPLISLFTLMVAMKVWGLQKTELLEMRRAVEEQGKTAEQQRREQRFFDLLSLYHTTVQSIATGVRDNQSGLLVVHGKEAIARLVVDNGFRSAVGSPRSDATDLPAQQSPRAAELSQRMGVLLDHYFRVVFTFLREAEIILGTEHFRYVKLFRAQLSRGELEALSINLVFDDEGRKMRSLVASYGLLKHLQESQLRRWAEEELTPNSFGRNYARTRTSAHNY